MSNGIVHFELPADDPEALIGFYTELFDWKIEKMPGGEGMDYWSIITTPVDENNMPSEPGAINGGLMRRMDPSQHTTNYVAVESVDSALEKAGGLGATVVVGKMAVPGMGWFAQLVDPQGNVFGLWQVDPAAA